MGYECGENGGYLHVCEGVSVCMHVYGLGMNIS